MNDVYKMLKAKNHSEVISMMNNKRYEKITNGSGDSSYTIMYPKDLKLGEEFLPAICCHSDIVGGIAPKHIVNRNGIVSVKNKGILGADDRLGCYMVSKMLRNDVRAIYMVFSGEEKGGIGVNNFVRNGELLEMLEENISAFIELDRENRDHFALYGYDNRELVSLFKDIGYHEKWGSYTDVVDLSEATGIACGNMSVGYHNQHTSGEFYVDEDMRRTLDTVLNRLPKQLWEKVFTATGGNSYGKYDDLSMTPVLCDHCSNHSPLYETIEGFFCAECLEIAEDIVYDDDYYSDEEEFAFSEDALWYKKGW